MITLEDLILAWRKAKVDLYYSTNPPLFEIADYEDKLIDNLERLRQRLNGEDQDWVTDPEFLGTWTLAPKAIKFSGGTKKPVDDENAAKETTLIFASPDAEWESLTTDKGERPTAEFRLSSRYLMDLSMQWTITIRCCQRKILNE